jgi:transposase-like protein
LTRTKKYEYAAKKLFSYLKEKFYDQFLERKKQGKKIKFVSDDLEHYMKGYKKYFYNVAEIEHGVPIACRKYGYEHNNNVAERDNQRVKQRYKVMRNFLYVKSANLILDFFDIHYNFIDETKLKGEKKSKTPAQRAGIELNLGKKYKLLELIKKSYAED